MRKIDYIVEKFEKHNQRLGKYDFTAMFNVTVEKGEWLYQDRELYALQLSIKVKVCYCTLEDDSQKILRKKIRLLIDKVRVTERFTKKKMLNQVSYQLWIQKIQCVKKIL